jgi:predicted phage-related endonuclease
MSVDLGDRTKYLGASDLGDCFSIPPYGCKRKLWYKKTGTAPDYPESDNFNFRRGHMLEPLGASLYAQETGQKIRRRNQIILDDQYDWMGCHLDREIVKDERGPGVLEVKSPTMRVFMDVKRKGANEAYLLQMQQMLNLRKASWGAWAFFSAELADLFHFEVLRDDELIAKIIEGAAAFWELVKRRTAPDKLEKKDKRCMKCGFQNSCQGITPEEYLAFADAGEGVEIVFDEELEQYAEERWSIKEIRDEANGMYDAVNDKIKLRMETLGASKVQCGGSKVYFTDVVTNRLDGKLLKLTKPDIYKEFVKPSHSKRLMLYKVNK